MASSIDQAMEDHELINVDVTQELFGLGETPGVPSHISNYLTASGSTLRGSQDAFVPRYCPPVEHTQIMGVSPAGAAERNDEPLRLPTDSINTKEIQEVGSESFTHSRPPISKIVVGERPRPAADEWEKRKAEIISLYDKERRSLRIVMAEMATKGFEATKPMYKRKFKKWGLRKNHPRKNYGKPDSRSVPTGLLHNAVAVRSPTNVSLRVPMPMRRTDFDESVHGILFSVRSLYTSSMDQGKWKITNPREVQEDIHDDLLVGVANALRSSKSLSPKFGEMGMMKAFKTLEKVVTDCGLFSLPTIWVSFLRMIRMGEPQCAKHFLSYATEWSKKVHHEHNHNPFVQALVALRKIEAHHSHMLVDVISRIYRSCIDLVRTKLPYFDLTTLSLWADFVVYVDNRSVNEIEEAVESFRLAILRSEKDNGYEDDYTLEILGLMLYVLQSSESTAEEAERVALDMLGRVDRRVKAGDKLEGKLLILWKDLRHTLGTFCHARGDLNLAVLYLEEYLSHGVVDDRDAFALERLEEWLTQLNRLNDARMVRQRRISTSQILLQVDAELAECESLDKENEEGNGDEGTDEGTYENDGSNGQTGEDEDAAEVDDAEVELQILQGEMEKLQRRMTILQNKVKNKGKQTASSVEY